MSDGLERLNQAGDAEAESMFRDCCGSHEWAKRMTRSRPFSSKNELIRAAVAIWNELGTSDRLEAFAAHPKIGETKAADSQQERSADWSAGEQAGMKSANDILKQDLAAANTEYFEKFGFIFIICATGKSGGEMLKICRERLNNDRQAEIANAAREQQKIIVIRLKKLLSQ